MSLLISYLGIGSYLIINGQLSIGKLIASEIFVNICAIRVTEI